MYRLVSCYRSLQFSAKNADISLRKQNQKNRPWDYQSNSSRCIDWEIFFDGHQKNTALDLGYLFKSSAIFVKFYDFRTWIPLLKNFPRDPNQYILGSPPSSSSDLLLTRGSTPKYIVLSYFAELLLFRGNNYMIIGNNY